MNWKWPEFRKLKIYSDVQSIKGLRIQLTVFRKQGKGLDQRRGCCDLFGHWLFSASTAGPFMSILFPGHHVPPKASSTWVFSNTGSTPVGEFRQLEFWTPVNTSPRVGWIHRPSFATTVANFLFLASIQIYTVFGAFWVLCIFELVVGQNAVWFADQNLGPS